MKGKLTLQVFVLFLLFIPLTMADQEWREYQRTPTHEGNYGDNILNLSGIWNDVASFTSVPFGADFQPLAVDMDLDGSLEFVFTDGNIFKVYTLDANDKLQLLDEYDSGYPQISNLVAIPYYDADSYVEVVGFFDDNKLRVFEWNGTALNNDTTTNVFFKPDNGVVCDNENCYWGTSYFLYKWNFNSDDLAVEAVMAGGDNFTFSTTFHVPPVLADIDRDGQMEFIAAMKNKSKPVSGNKHSEAIIVWDLNQTAKDSSFNGGAALTLCSDIDTNLCLGGGNSKLVPAIVGGITVYDVDAGNSEIIVSFSTNSTSWGDAYVLVLDSAGNPRFYNKTFDATSPAQAYISPPVIRNAEVSDTEPQFCVSGATISQNVGTQYNYISCYEADTGEKIFHNVTSEYQSVAYGETHITHNYRNRPILAGELDGITVTHALVSGGAVIHMPIYSEGTSTAGALYWIAQILDYAFFDWVDASRRADLYSAVTAGEYNFTMPLNITLSGGSKSQYKSFPILADMNGDNNLDICGSRDSYSYCSFSTYTNAPPELESGRPLITSPYTINQPICLDTTIEFRAYEDTYSPPHYTNDKYNDEERLASNCGVTTDMKNGTFYDGDAPNYPRLNCDFNQTGSISFQVYLQDDANPDDYTQYKSLTVTVVNGTAGLDCNFNPTPTEFDYVNDTTSVADELTSKEEIEEVIGILTLQSDYMKAILIIIFTIMFCFGLLKYTYARNPLIYATSIFALWILFAILGLLAWVYVFIFAIVGVGLGVAYFTATKGD